MGGLGQAGMALNPLCLVSLPIIIPDRWTRPNHDANMLLEQLFPAPLPLLCLPTWLMEFLAGGPCRVPSQL